MEVEVVRNRDRDKIFDNSYNRGDVECDYYNEPKVSSNFLSCVANTKTEYEIQKLIELNDVIDNLYKNSTWSMYIKDIKKITKNDITMLLEYLDSNIKDDSYSFCEIFTSIADYLDISYRLLYEVSSLDIKMRLNSELDVFFSVHNKPKNNCLF